MGKKIKKDFDKEQMYSKIMPSMVTPPPNARQEMFPSDEEETLSQTQFLLRNFMEDIILDKLDYTMEMLRCCDCERCKKDVMAKALNGLPAAYLVVERQELEAAVRRLRKNYEVKVSSALIQAVQEVKAAPKHQTGR